MLLSTEINLAYFEFLEVFFPFLTCLFIFFSAIALTKYLNTKTMVSAYFAITNIIFVSFYVIMEIGIIDAVNFNQKTDLYYFSVLYMNLGIIAASIFYYLFYSEIVSNERKQRYIVIFSGVAIILFQLIIWPEWFVSESTGGMRATYISQMLQTIFCGYVYISMGHQFLQLSRKAPEKRSELKAMGYGSYFMMVFFLTMILRVIFMNYATLVLIAQILTWIFMVLATTGFFVGFMLPNFKERTFKEN